MPRLRGSDQHLVTRARQAQNRPVGSNPQLVGGDQHLIHRAQYMERHGTPTPFVAPPPPPPQAPPPQPSASERYLQELMRQNEAARGRIAAQYEAALRDIENQQRAAMGQIDLMPTTLQNIYGTAPQLEEIATVQKEARLAQAEGLSPAANPEDIVAPFATASQQAINMGMENIPYLRLGAGAYFGSQRAQLTQARESALADAAAREADFQMQLLRMREEREAQERQRQWEAEQREKDRAIERERIRAAQREREGRRRAQKEAEAKARRIQRAEMRASLPGEAFGQTPGTFTRYRQLAPKEARRIETRNEKIITREARTKRPRTKEATYRIGTKQAFTVVQQRRGWTKQGHISPEAKRWGATHVFLPEKGKEKGRSHVVWYDARTGRVKEQHIERGPGKPVRSEKDQVRKMYDRAMKTGKYRRAAYLLDKYPRYLNDKVPPPEGKR